MSVGTGWRAADGVEDAHRVGQSAPHAVFHGIDLEEEKGCFERHHVQYRDRRKIIWGDGLCFLL